MAASSNAALLTHHFRKRKLCVYVHSHNRQTRARHITGYAPAHMFWNNTMAEKNPEQNDAAMRRKARLAEALRANLQKRKAQTRSRRTGQADLRPEGLLASSTEADGLKKNEKNGDKE